MFSSLEFVQCGREGGGLNFFFPVGLSTLWGLKTPIRDFLYKISLVSYLVALRVFLAFLYKINLVSYLGALSVCQDCLYMISLVSYPNVLKSLPGVPV